MGLNPKKTNIKGCYIFDLLKRGDDRGWFMETYKKSAYKLVGVPENLNQDNLSKSLEAGVFRGMHYQKGDAVQGKLVSCVQGKVIDYIYDARIGSPTKGELVEVLLDGDIMTPTQVYVPEGCLHGFYVLEGPAFFLYKCTNEYCYELDAGVRCTDPSLLLNLPTDKKLILSEKDEFKNPLLKDANLDFVYKPRCVVTGAIAGQLGPDVVEELKRRNYKDILVLDKDILDITDEEKVKEIIGNYNPDVIFHCAAYTEVDMAQRKPELAKAINVDGTRYITEVAKECNSKLIYVSTDYVFDGTKDGVYKVDDKPSPMSVYGKTKYEGENIAREHDKTFVARTSWVFGGLNTKNFVKTMLSLHGKVDNLSVVNDQIGSPTYSKDLAKRLVDLSESQKFGTYHINNEGYCTWYEFACKIFELAGLTMNVVPTTTEEYYRTEAMLKKIKSFLTEMGQDFGEELKEEDIDKVIAPRPKNSKLDREALPENGFPKLRDWEDATKEYVLELTLNEMRKGE